MEELSSLQQGYYYLSKHQFDEAKRSFAELVEAECEDPHPYIGLLLAENGLMSEGQLADLSKTLENYPLFMKGLAHAKGTYRESLLEIRAKQNLHLLKKEELYIELQKAMAAPLPEKEECLRLLGVVTELRDYKKSESYGEELRAHVDALEEAEKKARKKRTAIIAPICALLGVLLLVAVFFFTLPQRNGVRYVWTLDGYATMSAKADLSEVTLVEEIYGISVTKVGRSSFKDCKNLEKVYLHQGIDTIEKSAFNGCSKLISVSGAQGVSAVYGKAFRDCENLRDLRLCEGAFIEENAFRGCSKKIAVFAGDELVTVQTEGKK